MKFRYDPAKFLPLAVDQFMPGKIIYLHSVPDLDDLVGMDNPGLDPDSLDRVLAQNGLARVSSAWAEIVLGRP